MTRRWLVHRRPPILTRSWVAPDIDFLASSTTREWGSDAVEKLGADLHAGGDDIWVLYGEEGLQRIDVSGGMEGLRGRIVRMVELAMSSDIGYLRTLEGALESGGLVVSIPVANADAAESLANLLSTSSCHSFAYFSNWEFQPVRGALAN